MSTPIVLLHGVGLDHSMWDPLRGLLDDHLVLTPDLPGHGTQPPLREEQTLGSLAQAVGDALPRGPVHLVGFSLGALIAQHLARFRPGGVATLTLVSSVHRRSADQRAAMEGRFALAQRDFATSAAAAIERWFPAGSGADPDAVARVRRVLAATDVTSYRHAYAVFARGDAEIGPELQAITAPALVMTGALDPGSTPEMSRALAGELSGAGEAVIVPGARHMLPVENPAAVAEPLLGFLDAHCR